MNRACTYALPLVALAGCLDTPAEPTWARDVQPIVAANCVRCHGAVPSGGAPDSFRLDSYDDIVMPDGRIIRGAATMAQFMALRVDPLDSNDQGITAMPPRFGLSDRQVDIINLWFVRQRLRGPAGDGNRPPSITLRSPLGDALNSGIMTIQYAVADPDRDLVVGELRVGPDLAGSVGIGPIHDGRGELAWDIGVIAAGTYQVFAVLDDGGGAVEVALGSYEVVHPDGNVAPTVAVTTPAPYALLTDSIAPLAITVRVDDPDPLAVMTATIEAVRDDQRVVIAEDVPVTNGVNVISWDTTTVATEQLVTTGWTMRTTVSDGLDARTTQTPGLVISHQSTELRFGDVLTIFQDRCGGCHGELINGVPYVPGLLQNLESYEDYLDEDSGQLVRGVSSRRGLIYRRIAIQHNMPPSSLVKLGGELMTETERADLIEWLLGGAPE